MMRVLSDILRLSVCVFLSLSAWSCFTEYDTGDLDDLEPNMEVGRTRTNLHLLLVKSES